MKEQTKAIFTAMAVMVFIVASYSMISIACYNVRDDRMSLTEAEDKFKNDTTGYYREILSPNNITEAFKQK
jgi:hypothetical protein